ncbi:hypothetical protein AHiyo8_29100 [Arthrobacter sp. Hiyo8]|nr:hypothetical protein AHiyo8_29100 [Arthrobacter sp. Hiyo8]
MTTPEPIDLVIFSSSILHGEALTETAGFVAISNGRIAHVGRTDGEQTPNAAAEWTARAKQVIDVGEATVCPA